MISRERIEQLNRTIAEITTIYNQKIEEIINYAEEQRNNEAPVIIDSREVQDLGHIRAQINCLLRIRDNCLQILYDLEWLQDSYTNLSPEGSTFMQTRLSTRSNTSISSDSPSLSISPIENTRRIQKDFLTGQYDSDFEVEYRPIINPPRNRNIEVEPEDQLLINFDGSDNNNNLEPEREEPNEEDQDIEAYNNENLRQFLQQIHKIEPKSQLIAKRDMATFLQEFLVVAKTNGWDDNRKRAVFGAYLKKESREWYCEWVEDNNAHTWTKLRAAFIANHCTDDWCEQWQEELRKLLKNIFIKLEN
ncbi:hypothetical protein Glove_19g439 [Diversispora epigaea]|uniref:Retrotransposon gag domain-containing protein n=1 Tax=Diversispora epigaea TaxID=1348612 RepID=A0A397JV48_9GLOM|nr:hypothetical protein Glove_19g439 [Diversispora epigaea]